MSPHDSGSLADTDAPRAAFGRTLRGHRDRAGLTLEELAERSGVSVRAISDMERGRALRPRRRSIERLAVGLRLQHDETAALLATRAAPGRPVAATTVWEPSNTCALPPDPPGLAGRAVEFGALDQLAKTTRVDGSRILPLVTISGVGGVGKTAFAVAAGHRLADRFPHGQFFVNLHGTDAEPAAAQAALDRLLQALGASDAAIPGDLEARAGLYRTLLRDRRVLIILDDAASEAQVRPLLPASPGSQVLITSRHSLSGLATAHRLVLDVLAAEDAVALLSNLVGAERSGDGNALHRLAELCGFLPLALSIAANQLIGRPEWSVQDLVRQLANESDRLARLDSGDVAVRTAFEVSYRQLEPAEASMFRRLALISGPDFGAAIAAVAAGVDLASAEDAIEGLFDAGVLEDLGEDRYRFHDLIRLFAIEKLADDEPAVDVDVANSRLVTWLMHTATYAGAFFELDEQIAARLRQGASQAESFDDIHQAGAWLADELPNWLDAMRSAAAAGRHAEVLHLAEAMDGYAEFRSRLDCWTEVFRLGAAAAKAAGADVAEANMLNTLGWFVAWIEGEPSAGVATCESALAIARRCGDTHEQMWSHAYLASIHASRGDRESAIAHGEALLALRPPGEPSLQDVMRDSHIASMLESTGQLAEALEYQRAHVANLERLGAGHVSAHPVLRHRGYASMLYVLARMLRDVGQWAEAAETARRAVTIASESRGTPMLGTALVIEGTSLYRLGDLKAAKASLEQACAVFRQNPHPERHALALLGLADIAEAEADHRTAHSRRGEAFDMLKHLNTETSRRMAAELRARLDGSSH